MTSRTATTIIVSLLVASSAGWLATHRPGRRPPGSGTLGLPAASSGRSTTRLAVAGGPGAPASPRNRAASSPAEARENLGRRLRGILAMGEAVERQRALLALADSLSPGDFPLLLDVFHTLEVSPGSGAYDTVLSAWAASDPAGALTYAAGDEKQIQMILGAWAGKDPNAALDWALEQEKQDGSNPLLKLILSRVAMTDRTQAMALLEKVAPGDRQGVLLEMAQGIAAQGGDAALHEWVDSIADPQMKTLAVSSVIGTLPPERTPETIEWLKANPDALKEISLSTSYMLWAEKDPDAAMTSFESLPPGSPLHQQGLLGVLSHVTFSDLSAGLALMDRFPAEVTEEMKEHWTLIAESGQPEMALEEIPLITDPEKRDLHYRISLEKWLDSDPGAARKWMSRNEIPAGVRTALENR